MMQQFFIAMFAAAILLIALDMAITFLSAVNRPKLPRMPQDRELELKAEAFRSLAAAVSEVPPAQKNPEFQPGYQVWTKFKGKACRACDYAGLCEQSEFGQRRDCAARMAAHLSRHEQEQFENCTGEWMSLCYYGRETMRTMEECIREYFREMFWQQYIADVRQSAAMQLKEISGMLLQTAREIRKFEPFTERQMKRLQMEFWRKGLVVGQAWLCEQGNFRICLFLFLRCRNGRSVTTQEIARALSGLMNRGFVPEKNQKLVVGEEYQLFSFREDVGYEMISGISRACRKGETVCGDSFGSVSRQGQLYLCLSDGMGFGPSARQNSEHVLNLMEDFVECGFTKETAFHMINTSAMIGSADESYATMDICEVNLYTGVCEFLKAGAPASFICRDTYVECVALPGMAPGLLIQADFEKVRKKMLPGDTLVMITDGILEALPKDREIQIFQEILLHCTQGTPQERSRKILEAVLEQCTENAPDDMTVLVAGFWKKQKKA